MLKHHNTESSAHRVSPHSRWIWPIMVLALVNGCAAKREMVASCDFPTQPPPTGMALVSEEYGLTSPIPLNSIQFTDPGLEDLFVIQSIRAKRTDTDTVMVSARMVNCTGSVIQLGIRSTFFDKDQQLYGPPSGWKTIFLQPHALGYYQEASDGIDIAHYLLEFRNGRASGNF